MKPIIIIPARGGSKGVPGKNIKRLGGKPLIQYTIEAALELVDKDQIVVSTDSEDIKSVVESIGIEVPNLRPPELATDEATTQDVLLYELNRWISSGKECDYIVLLQPTSPFRISRHIKEAIEMYEDSLDMVVSVKETDANPYYLLKEEDEKGFLQPCKKINDVTRRQDAPIVWELNGAIYIINVSSLVKSPISKFTFVKKYIMNKFESHDIDTLFDWEIAEVMMSQNEI